MTYRCSTCGYETKNPERDPQIVYARGYHWHRGCAHILKEGTTIVVAFPSVGKIITQDE